MNDRLFTRDDAWNGGYFELGMHLGRQGEDRWRRTVSAVWQCRDIEGCWIRNDREPTEGSKVSPDDLDTDSLWRLYGIAHLPNGCLCPCASYGGVYESGDWWVDLCLPMGSLSNCCPVGAYPFDDHGDTAWVVTISEWLRGIAQQVSSVVPVPSAAIGSEASYDPEELVAIVTGDIPAERWAGYLRWEGTALRWYPPTVTNAPFSFD